MKVVFINTDDYLGGAAIACKRIAKSLGENFDIDVKILVKEKKFNDNFVVPHKDTVFFKWKSFLDFAFERAYFTLFEKSKEVRFAFSPGNFGTDISKHPLIQEADIIHLHFVNFGFLSVVDIQKLIETGKPIVWTMHDMWLFTGGCHHSGFDESYMTGCGNCEQYLKNPSGNDLSKKVYDRKMEAFKNLGKAVFVGCSQWLANRAKNSLLLKNRNVTSIPNPIDTQLFRPLEKEACRRELGLDTGKQYILFVAMKASVLWKGWTYLQQALEILIFENKVDNGTEILILGESDPEVMSLIPFKTHLLGRINDTGKISKIYNAADVFVIPSIMENLPNTIMEAMSVGLPCVGFEIGGIPEMIKHKETGYLAEYKSAEDFARGITWVLNESDREKLSENSRKKAEQQYAEKTVAGKYFRVYQQLLQ
jgi:glycosyltransferase involved in cell wall biosynthesis